MDLRRRCNRGPEKKVQPWTLEEGANVDLRRRCNRVPERICNRDLRRRGKRGPERRCKVQPWP